MKTSIFVPSSRNVILVTLRSPVPARYFKMFNSIKRAFQATLVTGTLFPTIHVRMSFGTVMSYANLFTKLSFNTRPAIIDINALASARFNLRRDLVVDFRTPFPYELKWLGHDLLSSFARSTEKILKDVGLVTAANELMAGYCTSLGAKKVVVVPNYPTKNFRLNIEAEKWKASHHLSPTDNVVLFTGGVRVKEIYGVDMLLESWRLVENSNGSCTLAILGDDSIDHIESKTRSLRIKRVLLPGVVSVSDVANWINCADVCVAPRTPGFSDIFYNDKDSTKISEYAAFQKPIVATRYSASDQYLLVDPNPIAFAEGILKGIDGKIRPSRPHFWEENESLLLRSLENFWFD